MRFLQPQEGFLCQTCHDQWHLRTWLPATKCPSRSSRQNSQHLLKRGSSGRWAATAFVETGRMCPIFQAHVAPCKGVLVWEQLRAGCQPPLTLSPSESHCCGLGGHRVTCRLLLGDLWRSWCWHSSQFPWFVTRFVKTTSSEISSVVQNKIKFSFRFQQVEIGKNMKKIGKLEA